MPQDVPAEQHAPAATSQPAATMLEPDYHPFAEEVAQMGQQPEQGASAPDAEPVPEASQPAAAPPVPQPTPEPDPTQASEPEPDFRTAYAELQRKYEEDRRKLEELEPKQQQWLEYQQRENERQAEEARKQAEQVFNQDLDDAFDRIASSNDDAAGKKILDGFVRKYAGQIAQHFQQQAEAERQQYEQNLTQMEQSALEQIKQAHTPGFVHSLVQKYELPDKEGAMSAYLRQFPVEQMEQMAANQKQLLAQAAPTIQHQAIQQAQQDRRASGVHAVGNVSGGPMAPRELRPMAADSTEAIETARALFGL